MGEMMGEKRMDMPDLKMTDVRPAYIPHLVPKVALFSRKLQLGWIRLQGVAGYNWLKQKPTLDYRMTTKWGDGPRLRRKERVRNQSILILDMRLRYSCFIFFSCAPSLA
jgi:hypothetical protein